MYSSFGILSSYRHHLITWQCYQELLREKSSLWSPLRKKAFYKFSDPYLTRIGDVKVYQQ